MSANPKLKIETGIDDLLERICEEVRLSDAKRKLAIERYLAVGTWISEAGRLAGWEPEIYPQGSLRIGTTVRPRGRNLFDLDIVCEFSRIDPRITNPATLLKALADRLAESDHYRGMFEVKNRCIRLIYQDDFHMDILPAIKDPASQTPGALLVPDRQAKGWKPSNPKGYAAWFETQAGVVPLQKSISPLITNPNDPPALVMMVQILKHWRDTHFVERPEAAISIVLTTLAGKHSGGDELISSGVDRIISEVLREIASHEALGVRIEVRNPANAKEDLSERWDDRELYKEFLTRFRLLADGWKRVLSARGADAVVEELSKLLDGEVVRRAARKQAEALQSRRVSAGLGVGSTGELLIGGNGRPVPRNNFYGD